MKSGSAGCRRLAAVASLAALAVTVPLASCTSKPEDAPSAASVSSPVPSQRQSQATRVAPPVTGGSPDIGAPSNAQAPSDPSWPPGAVPGDHGMLAPGSDPSVLPGPMVIADRDNNRLVVVDPQGRVVWQWPQPGDLAPGQTFKVPDDAFFTPDGKHIVVTQEDDFVVTEIDIASRKIVWRYGIPGTHGSGPGLLWNPDDAMMLADGNVVVADIKNCRLLQLKPGVGSPIWQLGHPGACRHDPPSTFGSPNGAFILPNGHLLVTEINGAWAEEMDLTGHVYWAARPDHVAYPSDTSQYKPGEFVTADYSSLGQVAIFDTTGKVVWRWNPPTGDGRLNHPSLAVGLPNGDILLNDDRNHRVIVIDPRSNRIVWQYGHTGVAGAGAGFLNNPDGLDLVPPSSYADVVGIGSR